ncbi:MAG: NADH-quinone oxidoreductase subunit J [Parvibaculaceae bacterium]|jgi:NADH-quinone oxidoreductase subunit J|nr:NADH-quinone oxidoreductase subunit J [Parvibaculaceae bacterium]
MVVAAIAFYIFAGIAVAAAFMVIAARNPVHSVLYLILTFFSAAGLFVLMGAEFLAMILLIVYVGAVAVLFLFVVMMLDVNFASLREGFLQYLPIGALVGFVLFLEMVMVIGTWVIAPETAHLAQSPIPPLGDVTNAEAIGRVMYTQYIYFFQAAGMVLLVAMIGAIVLTLRHREGVQRQSITAQVGRRAEDALEIRKVEPGQGISEL